LVSAKVSSIKCNSFEDPTDSVHLHDAIFDVLTGTGIRIFGAKNSQGAEWRLRIDGGDGSGGQTYQLSSFLDAPKTRNLLLFDSADTLGSVNNQHSLEMEHRGVEGREALDFERLELLQLIDDENGGQE